MANKYKTEVGTIMEALNYQQSEVEKWDNIAFSLYCAPYTEQKEHLAVLMWYLLGDDCLDDDFPKDHYKRLFKQFNAILAERNK